MERRGAARGAPSPFPDVVPPMLPTKGDLADGERGDWAVEFAWSGFRCVAYVRPGHVRLLSSTARSVTSSFPELAVLGERAKGAGMVLDGVVVALDAAGRPSRGPLMRRANTHTPSDSLRDRVPVGFVVTDLLWLDGRSLLRRPYAERRRLLEGLGIAGPPVLVPPSHPADEADFVMEAAERYGLEGLHLKRTDAAYKAGRRARDWLRVPLRRSRAVVVGGWMPAHRGRVGALLLGIPDGPSGALRYVGRVGVGSGSAARALAGRIRTLHARTSPFVSGPGAVPEGVAAEARWLRPEMAGRADYQGWTRDGRLRLPVWGGLLDRAGLDADAWAGTPWETGEEQGSDTIVLGGPPAAGAGAGTAGVGAGTAGVGPAGVGPAGVGPAGVGPAGVGTAGSGAGTAGVGAGTAGVAAGMAGDGASGTAAGPPAGTPALPATQDPAPAAWNRSLEQHFVYNAFNTIASLMRTDPDQARTLLLEFADLSRAADRAGLPAIPLADEIAGVQAYLDIEHARFGRRLTHQITVGADPEDLVVEPLAVLAAVRDVVQRTIEPSPTGGRITVTVAGDGPAAEVVISWTAGDDHGTLVQRLRAGSPSAV